MKVTHVPPEPKEFKVIIELTNTETQALAEALRRNTTPLTDLPRHIQDFIQRFRMKLYGKRENGTFIDSSFPQGWK